MRLGSILDTAGLTKSNLMKAVKLGVGAAAFPIVYGYLRSLLVGRVSQLAQGTPVEMATRAVAGLALGHFVGNTRILGGSREMGDGMMASAVGTLVSDLLMPYLNPAAGAAKAAVTATELQGIPAFSASNPLGASLAGLGYGAGGDQSLLFGVGTPDMSANRMFNGATVAIEEKGLAGATVVIESPPAFAGALY